MSLEQFSFVLITLVGAISITHRVSVKDWTLNTSCPASSSRGCWGIHHAPVCRWPLAEVMCLGFEEDCHRWCPSHVVTHALECALPPIPEQGSSDVASERATWWRPSPGEELVNAPLVFPVCASIHCVKQSAVRTQLRCSWETPSSDASLEKKGGSVECSVC